MKTNIQFDCFIIFIYNIHIKIKWSIIYCMEIIDIINIIGKVSCINILIYVVFKKLINYKNEKRTKDFVIIVVSFIEAIIYTILGQYLTLLITILIVYSMYGIIISKLVSKRKIYTITITFISFAIVYLFYVVAILLSGFILKIVYPDIKIENMLILVGAIIIEYIMLYNLFKVKRLKKGISFLKNEEKINNIGIIGFSFIGITILTYSLLGNSFRGITFNTYLFTGIIIEIICLIVWIRRKITKYYKQKLKEKTIEELENEIKQKDLEISKILKENQDIATINHKYSNRIKSLEEISAQILSKPEIIEKMKVEFGTDFGDIQKQINKISEEYSKEMQENIKHEKQLVKTGIFGIDNILEYMKKEAEKSNIKFELKINANIKYMIENIIDQSKLETLLGDHIKDAIIAINHSNNTYRSILTIIAIIEDCYEICIYDTGIEFEIETLLNLGTKPITTHKETGGSGIGFMTTFETLKETKASLIIEEKHEMNNTDYTKAVRIRFDGKNEYRISSYRAEKIKKQKKDNRIKIQEYHYKSIKNQA